MATTRSGFRIGVIFNKNKPSVKLQRAFFFRRITISEFFYVLKYSGLSSAINNELSKILVRNFKRRNDKWPLWLRIISKMEFALRSPNNDVEKFNYPQSDFLIGYFSYWRSDTKCLMDMKNPIQRAGFKEAVLEISECK